MADLTTPGGRIYYGPHRIRTTDNAAADTQHTASPVSDSPTQPAAPTSKVNAIGTVCHAPGERCLGCAHYYGKADVCVYAAAPTQTPWTDRHAVTEIVRGINNIYEIQKVSTAFARRLEALVHRQHEAFRKIDAFLFDTDGTGFVALEADQREQAMRLCDELRDTYAALEKEIERE